MIPGSSGLSVLRTVMEAVSPLKSVKLVRPTLAKIRIATGTMSSNSKYLNSKCIFFPLLATLRLRKYRRAFASFWRTFISL